MRCAITELSDLPEHKAHRRKLVLRLWREHLRRYWRLLALILPLVAVVGATAGAYVFITEQAGELLTRGDARIVYQIPAWIVAISLLRAVAMYAQTLITSELAHRVLRDLQGKMFEALLRADYARISAEPVGALVSRFVSDVNVIAEGLVRSVSSTLRDVAVIIAVFVSMLRLDWALAIGVIAILMLSMGPLAQIAQRARRQTREAQVQMGDLTALLSESLHGGRLVRAYGLEEYESDRAGAAFERRRRMQMRLVRNRARSDPLLEALGGLAAAAVFAFIGWRIVHGQADVSDLLALIAAIATASASARSLGTFNTVLNESLTALDRVFALIDEKPSVIDKPGAPALLVEKGGIVFEDVSFAYGARDPAVRGVSFAVAPGERVALVGASGSGKSTIINLLPRLFDPTAGRILIDGQDIRGVSLASLRAAIGLVSQDITLFNDSVAANIAFGQPGATMQDIKSAARRAAADDFIESLPQGFDTVVGEQGGTLSGGQRQRIALARAFLRNAPILLLDEATSALDAESERRVQDAVFSLAQGRTTLIIAHKLSTVRHADRILVIEAGRIVEEGDHEALMAREGVYAAFARLQLAEPRAA